MATPGATVGINALLTPGGAQGPGGSAGSVGPAGPAGPPGGASANTTLTAAFSMPAVGSTAVASVANAGAFSVGGIVYINPIGYLSVQAVGSGQLTLQNLGSSGNQAPGSSAPSGNAITGVGPQGPAGPAGIQGVAGNQGVPGTSPTLAVGTTVTGAAGTNAAVSDSGSASAHVFNFTIPQGVQGVQGNAGVQGIQGPAGGQGVQGNTGPQGIPGTNGNTIWSGTVIPSNSTGVNGDFYLNTATSMLYGPKAGGAWPAGVSLIGATGATGSQGPAGVAGTSGNTILSGTTQPPSASLGNNGDYYLNTTNSTLWGPKASGAWPGTGTSLIGPQGNPGAQGNPGSQGPAGPTAVSVDPNNEAKLGSDSLIYVPFGNALDYGDLTPPASPSAYDDEFTATTLNAKWTLTTAAGCTQGLVAPTYFTQQLPNGAAAGTSTAVEPIVTAAGFMFQFRLKLLLNAWAGLAANAVTDATAGCALTVGSKGFGFEFESYQGLDSTGAIVTTSNVFLATRGSGGFATGISVSECQANTGLDWRIRLGISGANLVAQLSPDAYNWLTVWSEVFSSGASLGGQFPTSLTLRINTAGANNSVMAAWDYVRKIA